MHGQCLCQATCNPLAVRALYVIVYCAPTDLRNIREFFCYQRLMMELLTHEILRKLRWWLFLVAATMELKLKIAFKTRISEMLGDIALFDFASHCYRLFSHGL